MHRFFVEPDSLSNDCIIIEGSDFSKTMNATDGKLIGKGAFFKEKEV